MRKPRVRPVDTGRIAPGVWALRTGLVSFYAVKAGDDLLCIDTGYGRGRVRAALKELDMDPAAVSHVFLTHSDFDHVGGLPVFPGAAVYLSAGELPLIRGERVRMAGLLRNGPVRRPLRSLDDGDEVRVGDTVVRAVAVPGHTPGSMAYRVGDVLFTGDAFKLRDGAVWAKESFINMDAVLLRRSIAKLAGQQGVALVCTGHSGYSRDFAGAMADWMTRGEKS